MSKIHFLSDSEPASRDDRRVGAQYVAQLLGVSVRTLDRWLKNPEIGLPRPIVINSYRYWSLAKVRAWEACRAEAEE
jgi:predicted DNA-binding transcriptional regulator AlpA